MQTSEFKQTSESQPNFFWMFKHTQNMFLRFLLWAQNINITCRESLSPWPPWEQRRQPVKFDFGAAQITFPSKILLPMACCPVSDSELIYLQSKSLSRALTVNEPPQWFIRMWRRWNADKVGATTPQVASGWETSQCALYSLSGSVSVESVNYRSAFITSKRALGC